MKQTTKKEKAAKKKTKKKCDTLLLKHVVMKNPTYAIRAHFALPAFAGNESAMTTTRAKEALHCCWPYTAVAAACYFTNENGLTPKKKQHTIIMMIAPNGVQERE